MCDLDGVICNAQTGRVLRVPDESAAGSFLPSGNAFAIGTWDDDEGGLKIFDVRSLEEQLEESDDHEDLGPGLFAMDRFRAGEVKRLKGPQVGRTIISSLSTLTSQIPNCHRSTLLPCQSRQTDSWQLRDHVGTASSCGTLAPVDRSQCFGGAKQTILRLAPSHLSTFALLTVTCARRQTRNLSFRPGSTASEGTLAYTYQERGERQLQHRKSAIRLGESQND